MRTFQSQSQAAQRGASNSPHGLTSGGVAGPLSPASITLISALLILTIPVCCTKGAPAEVQKIITDQLFSEIGAMCSSYLSADLTFRGTDALGELCFLMLVQKSKELQVRENSKRTPLSRTLLHLVSKLHTRQENGLVMRTDFQGPAGIQNRGYFLYRPRNGRRVIEYE